MAASRPSWGERRRRRKEEKEERERQEAERQAVLREEFWRDKKVSEGYVRWAVSQLTPAQRLFLDSVKRQDFRRPVRHMNWSWVARSAGQQPWHADRWVSVLERYELIGHYDRFVDLNPGLKGVEVLGPLTRQGRNDPEPQ